MGSASDPLSERRGWAAEEIRSLWYWAPGSRFLNNSEFSLTWQLVRNAFPLVGLNYRAGLAEMPDCPRCGSGLEETVSMPSTIASEFARFGITSASGRLASNQSSSCCLTLVTSWSTFFLRFRVRSVWCFSRS